jgi:hypothetical protein
LVVVMTTTKVDTSINSFHELTSENFYSEVLPGNVNVKNIKM